MDDSTKEVPANPPRGDDMSPFEPGECPCGIPNCAGHPAVNGEIHIPNHPLGYIVMKVPVKPRE